MRQPKRFACVTASRFSLGWLCLPALLAGCQPNVPTADPPQVSACGLFASDCVPIAGGGPFPLALRDWNGDGDLDLASANVLANNVSIIDNNGDAVFQEIATLPVGIVPTGMASEDFNGDGAFDFVTANLNTGNLSVYLNAGDGTFDLHATVDAGTLPSRVVAADLDGVNGVDLVVAFGSDVLDLTGNGRLAVFLNDGNANFSAQPEMEFPSAPTAVEVADFDGDGDLDVALAGQDIVQTTQLINSEVSILLNNGDASFETGDTQSVGIFPFTMATADVNGDGTADLIVGNWGNLVNAEVPSTISVLTNDGDGAFETLDTLVLDTLPYFVAAADLDGDGDADFVLAEDLADKVSIWTNDGMGMFTKSGDVVTGGGPEFVIIGDLDADNDRDLAVALFRGDSVAILLNDGNANFVAGP